MKKQMLSILEGNKTNLSSRQFVGRDLPHPLLLGQEEKQPCFTKDVEDPRQRPSGMTFVFYNDNSMGFTLIELLVVVLIIGILAAVALPQYQKAVERSRAAQAITLLKSISQAADAYHMANGDFPTTFDELDVEVPDSWSGHNNWYNYVVTDSRSTDDWSFLIEGNNSDWYSLVVGRTSGKYNGAGFIYWKKVTDSTLNIGEIYCFEYPTIFAGAEGDYCQKIMKGTKVIQSTFTVFRLP